MRSDYFHKFPSFFSVHAAAGQMTPAEAELPGWWHSTSSVGSPFHQVSHLRRSEGEETQAPIPVPSFCPPLFMFHCVCYTRHLFLFFPTPPTSMGPPTEGWWGSDPAALPGLASLLIGVHLVSPAAMNAAVMLPSHRHFLGTLQRFFGHPSAVFKLLLWLWRFWRCGLLPSSSLRDKSVQHPNYDQFYIFACLSHCWNQCWITFFSLVLTSGLLCTCRIRKPKQVLLFQKIQLWP